MELTKKCIKCSKDKLLGEFGNNSKTKDGKRVDCKECVKAYNQNRYAHNRDIIISKNREWALENPDKVKLIQKKFREK